MFTKKYQNHTFDIQIDSDFWRYQRIYSNLTYSSQGNTGISFHGVVQNILFKRRKTFAINKIEKPFRNNERVDYQYFINLRTKFSAK